ncbi:ROK family protein [Patescibacteria group bacterium]|nr:ROK family protein [Patescibacteria group bacterium]
MKKSKLPYYIGVDVGGTKIAAALITNNKIQKRIKIPTESSRGKKVVLKNIETAVREVWQKNVKAIGVSFAGQIDQKKGIVIVSPNFSKNFKNVKVAAFLKKKFKKPTFVENDTNCFALAESVLGAGKKYKYVVGLTIGTGVGSSMIFDGIIFHGENGAAGEWGHTSIVENGLTCSCKQVGHFETYASGSGMSKLYKKITGKEKDTFYIEQQAKKGDKHAKLVLKIMSESLGVGIANIINALNPSIIIIGGGMIRVNDLWSPALKIARKKAVYPILKKTKIVKSKLKDDAGLLGATLIIRN